MLCRRADAVAAADGARDGLRATSVALTLPVDLTRLRKLGSLVVVVVFVVLLCCAAAVVVVFVVICLVGVPLGVSVTRTRFIRDLNEEVGDRSSCQSRPGELTDWRRQRESMTNASRATSVARLSSNNHRRRPKSDVQAGTRLASELYGDARAECAYSRPAENWSLRMTPAHSERVAEQLYDL
jgi:uncharacterized membrane protein